MIECFKCMVIDRGKMLYDQFMILPLCETWKFAEPKMKCWYISDNWECSCRETRLY